MPIQRVKAREIFNSCGNPTIEVDVITDIGLLRSSIPSNLLQNPNEAVDLKDGVENLYNGKSVNKAISNINTIIAPELLHSKLDVCQQKEIDNLLIKLDGTDNKSKLGANAILSVSVACCKAGAAKRGLPLYKYIAELAENKQLVIPVPCFNIISGGSAASNLLVCQEFMILPTGASNFQQAMKMGIDVYRDVEKKLAEQQDAKVPLTVSDEGTFVPLDLEDDKEVIGLISDSIKNCGYDGKIQIAIDMAASNFCKDGQYDLEYKTEESDPEDYLESEALKERYLEFLSEFPILASIEDPFDQEDWESWPELLKEQEKLQLVADDLVAMNIERLEEAVERGAANSLIIRPLQIGTITETVNLVKMARLHNWGYIVSAGFYETDDHFVADLAVGLAAGQFKAGAPCRSERISKYNQILRIEEELGKDAQFAGVNFRNPLN